MTTTADAQATTLDERVEAWEMFARDVLDPLRAGGQAGSG